jgi:hypothetical protein
MRTSHGKFYKTLVDKEKDNLTECISRMALKLSPAEGIEGMGFDIIDDEDDNEMIPALNPVARRALLGYHGQGPVNSLGFVAEIVFKGALIYWNDIRFSIQKCCKNCITR